MKKVLVAIIFVICLATGAQAQQITGSTKLTVASTQSSSQGLLSGCTYIGSGGCSLPAGWTVVAQQDFECSNSHATPANPSCGTLPGNQDTSASYPNTPNKFETSQAHSGSYGFGGLYGGDGDQVNWILKQGAIGSFATVYLSWWEYTDPNAKYGNSDYFINLMFGPPCGGGGSGNGFNAQDTNVSNGNLAPSNTSFIVTGGNGDEVTIRIAKGNSFIGRAPSRHDGRNWRQ